MLSRLDPGPRASVIPPEVVPFYPAANNAARFPIVLVLEENGQVAFGEISQDNGVGQCVPPK